MKDFSPALLRYIEAFEKNSKSKVFAPLALTYQKMGLLDEAFKVLKKGLKVHPHYDLGQFALASCYFEQKKYENCYNVLKSLVDKNADNISIKKLYGDVCLKVGETGEALKTYKHLLFMNPKNKEYQEKVESLENSEEEVSEVVVENKDHLEDFALHQLGVDEIKEMVEKTKDSTEEDFSWKPFDLNVQENDTFIDELLFHSHNQVAEKPQEPSQEKSNISELRPKKTKTSKREEKKKKTQGSPTHEKSQSSKNIGESSPLVTHTLVDLYMAQGHFAKAKEVLEKILELMPKNSKTLKMLEEVNQKLQETTDGAPNLDAPTFPLGNISAASGKKPHTDDLRDTYDLFLEKIKLRAQEIHHSHKFAQKN